MCSSDLHHIRNSLVAVKTFLDLAPIKLKAEDLNLDQLRNPEFWNDYYLSVQRQIEKINRLLEDLWSAPARGDSDFHDEASIEEILSAALGALEADFGKGNIAVRRIIPTGLPKLRVEKAKFTRLFELLFRDELAYLPAGSEVTVEARFRAPALGETAEDSAIEVIIGDNGPVTAQEAIRTIFDPFATRSGSPKEYGVNLIAAYFIVHHHGGRITARRNGERGTLFQIQVPLRSKPISVVEESREFMEKVLLNERIWRQMLVSH